VKRKKNYPSSFKDLGFRFILFFSLLLFFGQATGAAILEDLQRQRQAIERSREQLQQTDASITDSDSILEKMGRWWRF
jgi:hypothetical protein